MTECGKDFEHDPHLYERDDQKWVCDGIFIEKKR